MAQLLHQQPFKTIYILGFLAVVAFVRLPSRLIYYSWRPNRPKKNWTFRRAIRARILREVTQLPFKIGVFSDRDSSLEVPQKELEPYNSRFVWVPELEKEDIVGMVGDYAARARVKSVVVPAFWILKEGVKWSAAHEKVHKGEKVILYLHGGAFMMGTAHPYHPTSSVLKGILKYSASHSRVLSVDYRLSCGPPFKPKNPFPTAVIDAIAAYKYLVCEVGFLAQNITVAGDSAGGNLALALIRYTLESRLPHLQPPGGLIATSPVTDISLSRPETDSSRFLNVESDIFTPSRDIAALITGAYIGEIDLEETKYNRYLSPASKFVEPAKIDEDVKLFSGFPRSYIMGGGAEALFDDIVALTEKMKGDGVDVTTDFPPDAVHAYPIFSWHEPERTESFIKCAAWLGEKWPAEDKHAK